MPVTCGIPILAAVSIYSMEGLGGLFGRVLIGLAGRSLGEPSVCWWRGLLVQAVGAGAYFFVRNLEGFYSVAAIFGFAYGGVMPLYAVIAREYFGLRIMGHRDRRRDHGLRARHGAGARTRGMDLRHVRHLWLASTSASSAIGFGAAAIALAFPAVPFGAPRGAERGGVGMQLANYLFFTTQCEAALAFYTECGPRQGHGDGAPRR